jgi:hypothetical protein
MNGWFHTLRFLWEEDLTPPEEMPHLGRGGPAGVPQPLRHATRLAIAGVVATTLLGQVIGVRLVAPVDASPSYAQKCEVRCNEAYKACHKACPKGHDDANSKASSKVRKNEDADEDADEDSDEDSNGDSKEDKACKSACQEAHKACIRSCHGH